MVYESENKKQQHLLRVKVTLTSWRIATQWFCHLSHEGFPPSGGGVIQWVSLLTRSKRHQNVKQEVWCHLLLLFLGGITVTITATMIMMQNNLFKRHPSPVFVSLSPLVYGLINRMLPLRALHMWSCHCSRWQNTGGVTLLWTSGDQQCRLFITLWKVPQSCCPSSCRQDRYDFMQVSCECT